MNSGGDVTCIDIKESKKAMRALGFELKREDYKKLRAPDDEEEDDTKGVIYFNKFL